MIKYADYRKTFVNLVEEQHEIDAESENQCHVFQIVEISCQEGYHTMTVLR